jgi:hypothetical protein
MCFCVLFVGVKAFMQVAKKGDVFLMYVLPSLDVEPWPHKILSQYKKFKDVFKKKNAYTLPKHRPYDYTIDLEERAQPPFGPIYNLSQDKLVTLHEDMNKNIEKEFIQHSKFIAGAPILFVKKKDDSL